MSYKQIGDYGVVGNGVTVALVGRDGSIDWMCLPHMDSPSVFAAILDDEKGGRFSVAPCAAWDSAQRYLPRTNVLQTLFRTSSGELELTDFMPVGELVQEHPLRESGLLRRARVLRGEMEIAIECAPRFQYGSVAPEWPEAVDGRWILRGDEERLSFWASRELDFESERARLHLKEGETLWLSMAYEEPPEGLSVEMAQELLDETVQYWERWIQAEEFGKHPRQGHWQGTLERSALVLKMLQFRDTGAIAAAATTSLPTIVYGCRNWDYRYSWIRDTAMTLTALFELGHVEEVGSFLEWLKELLRRHDIADLKVMYQLTRPEPPNDENPVAGLRGYKGSKPVNLGQHNVQQTQHDIYGELMDMIFRVSQCVGKLGMDDWEAVRPIVDHVAKVWREKDHGIWELRTGPHHDTHSKVMCWVALDRGIIIAEHYGFPADLDHWKRERDAVRADILKNGYSEKLGRFRQHYGTDVIDAALLRLPLVGFLPADDERMVRTIQAVEEELMVDGLVRRYSGEDGLPGVEHGFLICFFWYLRCLIRQNRFDEVDGYLRRSNLFNNDLGLFGEQYDPRYREITGNYPQALSHIGFATTVLELIEARRERTEPESLSWRDKLRLALQPRLLTPEPQLSVEADAPDSKPDQEIKRIVHLLQGEFYDGHRQRVDYPLIRGSEYYKVFLHAVAKLRDFDPERLETDADKTAFWLNVFNTLVIHGVIELGIKESVKEAPGFFERVEYAIGGQRYALADIEHGILRGNAKAPRAFRPRFKDGDPRLAHRVKKMDARVHFGLVCASRTCPPIEAYSAENLDTQLDTSAKVFVNGHSRVDRDRCALAVPVIFKWYRDDFPGPGPKLVRYLARHWYDPGTRDWLDAEADRIRIEHLPYDWRLNR